VQACNDASILYNIIVSNYDSALMIMFEFLIGRYFLLLNSLISITSRYWVYVTEYIYQYLLLRIQQLFVTLFLKENFIF